MFESNDGFFEALAVVDTKYYNIWAHSLFDIPYHTNVRPVKVAGDQLKFKAKSFNCNIINIRAQIFKIYLRSVSLCSSCGLLSNL